MFLKQIFAREAKLQGQFWEQQISAGQLPDRYFRDINALLSLLFTTKFSSSLVQNKLNYFRAFKIKAVKAKYKIEKENGQPLNTISIAYFLQTRLFAEKIFPDQYHPSGYFPRTGTTWTIVFLSRNYKLLVAPRKFDVLKTNICPRSDASKANMLVLRTSNFQGATIRPIVPRHTLCLRLLFTTEFSYRPASSKINWVSFNFLR